jgi:hypothetical protein
MKKMLLFKTLLLTFILLILVPTTNPASGQVIVDIKQDKGMGIAALTGGDQNNLIKTIFTNVITLFFTVGALGFTIMIIWGAVDWILSGGDKEKVANARKRITQAIVGLVVLSLSFVIMLVVGQILSIDALQYGRFNIPGLGDPVK